jgi:hypothetical protein
MPRLFVMKGSTMCDHGPDLMIERILADELVRLAMASDGINEEEMQRLLEHARRAVVGRRVQEQESEATSVQ